MDKELYYKKLKRLCLIFAFGLFGGCIYFNLLWRSQGILFQNEWGMVFDRFIVCSLADIYKWLQSYTVWILSFHIVICVLGITRIGKVLVEGIVVTVGFLVGAAETLLLMSFDIKESILFLMRVMGGVLVYAFVLGSTFVFVCSMSSLKWTSWGKSKKWKGIQLKKYLILVFGPLFLHMVYILMSSYVNF